MDILGDPSSWVRMGMPEEVPMAPCSLQVSIHLGCIDADLVMDQKGSPKHNIV